MTKLKAELDNVRTQNQDLVKAKEEQEALMKMLRDETEQQVAKLHLPGHDSCGAADHPVGEIVGVLMPTQPLGGAIPDANGMTIQEIKECLIDRGYEGEVWELASRRTPRVKKADWVALLNASI